LEQQQLKYNRTMEFLQQLHNWTKGEVTQGRGMLAFAILLLPVIVIVIKNTQTLQKGMTIPIILLFAVQVGYGSYLLVSRTKQKEQTEKQFQQNQQQAITAELSKAENDSRTYTALKCAWGALTAISVIGYFAFSNDYYKGLSLGFAVMFLALLYTDTLLHQRLSLYMQFLQKLAESK